MGRKQVTVFSAITGDYDNPRDDNVLTFSKYDKFKDPVMNAKIYKVLPHLFMDTEWSIWIDGNLTLKMDPEDLVGMVKGDIAVFTHPNRDCLYDEAEECKRLKLDSAEVINKQIEQYDLEGFPKSAGLGACFLIIRRHTPEINRLNERWWAEICRSSKRDQISFPYVFRDVDYLPIVNSFDNPYFTRKPHQKKR